MRHANMKAENFYLKLVRIYFFFKDSAPGLLFAGDMDLVMVAPLTICLGSFTFASELAHASFNNFFI